MGLSARNAILQKRPTWLRVAGQLTVLATASCFPACIASQTTLGTALGLGGMAAMLILAQVSRWTTRTSNGLLQVDDRGIAVGELVIPVADLPPGVVCDVVDSRGVVLRPRGSTSTIHVDEAVLGPLLEALRVHFRARPRFPVNARLSLRDGAAIGGAVGVLALLVGVAAMLGASAGYGIGLLGVACTLFASALLYRSLGKRRLTVGADGIAVRTAIGTQQLLPYSHVESVVKVGPDVRVLLKGGNVYCVGFGFAPTGEHYERCEARAAMLAFVIHSAKAAYEHAGAFGEKGRKAAVLARGGRNVTDWMHALRTLNETQASFRSATIPDDELWRITEDPTEGEPVRVAAAIALRDRLDDGGRKRLRLVVDSCVAPRLRVALDAAVDRDDASLTRALEELEDVEPLDHARRIPKT